MECVVCTTCLRVNRSAHVACTFNCFISKINDFSRSQPVTYTINVVISRKRFKVESLLPQTTNRKWRIAHRTAAIPMTLSDLQGHSPTACLTALQQLTRFQLTYCVARFPPIAELLVEICERTDKQTNRQTYRQADHNTSQPYWERSKTNW